MSVVEERSQRDGVSVCQLPPDFDKRLYSAHSIAAIVMQLRKQDVRPSLALAGTGVDETQLESHATKISYRQLDIVIRNALRLSNDPALALRAGQSMHVTAYGMYGYALLSSPTYAEAREFASRYIRVIGPLCDSAYSYDGPAVVCSVEPLHWPNPSEQVHRFAAEFALAAHLTTLKDLVSEKFAFSEVALDYAEPTHASLYRSLFGCPILFAQRRNEYRYELSQADGPVVLADPRTYGMASEMCEQLLEEIDRAGGVAADIRRILVERPGRYPSIEAIAERLSMHPRALRRRLETEDTSYRDLLAEVRTRLSIEYLRKTDMTTEEIASRLGYSDASNFRHAFVRWTGRSPSDFRIARDTL